jgi:hypothetical protein
VGRRRLVGTKEHGERPVRLSEARTVPHDLVGWPARVGAAEVGSTRFDTVLRRECRRCETLQLTSRPDAAGPADKGTPRCGLTSASRGAPPGHSIRVPSPAALSRQTSPGERKAPTSGPAGRETAVPRRGNQVQVTPPRCTAGLVLSAISRSTSARLT